MDELEQGTMEEGWTNVDNTAGSQAEAAENGRECAICKHFFEDKDVEGMATKIISSDPDPGSRPYEVKIVDALAYVSGIPGVEYNAKLQEVLNTTSRLSGTMEDSDFELVACVICAYALAKLHTDLKSFRKLTKPVAIHSQVVENYLENEKESRQMKVPKPPPRPRPGPASKKPKNLLVTSNGATRNTSSYEIDPNVSVKFEPEEPLDSESFLGLDLDNLEDNEDDTDPLHDPLEDPPVRSSNRPTRSSAKRGRYTDEDFSNIPGYDSDSDDDRQQSKPRGSTSARKVKKQLYNWICEICQKSCSRRSDLTRHMKVHEKKQPEPKRPPPALIKIKKSNPAPVVPPAIQEKILPKPNEHLCPICKKVFSTSFGLQAHTNVSHTIKIT